MTAFQTTGAFGPFAVAPAQIAALGPKFVPFVNELLAAEAATAGLGGPSLATTYRDNLGDSGVDAGLRSETATDWIPLGDSAWQFKAGDLAPAKCKEELKGASRALEILKAGGTYRLVLGRSMTEKMVTARRKALEDQARELGISVVDRTFEVYTADSLARWSSNYAALAASQFLDGIGHDAQSFDSWANSVMHGTTWVASGERTDVIAAVHKFLSDPESVDFRVRGESGLGKTRVVMEALRDHPLQALVVYLRASDAMPPGFMTQLIAQERTAIVVIDECGGRKHKSIAELIPRNAPLKLISIGEADKERGHRPTLALQGLLPDNLDEVLKTNQPSLGPEARRVVVNMAAGNVGYALALARIVAANPGMSASQLITASDVEQYLTDDLPKGAVFLGCSALALFTSIGFDGDVANELDIVGYALGLSVGDLRSAASELRRLGLLSERGRFRAVSPHPLAVYLASEAWREYGNQIAGVLIPALNSDMAERLFQRAADIGAFEPTRRAVEYLFAANGPFATLDAIEAGRNGRLLSQLAIVAPSETCAHLSALVSDASEEDLRSRTGIRRDLVWTLEKLVWHTGTFGAAADALLRLSLAENESFGNNATGSWIELFGALLPATAATAEARRAYLQSRSLSEDSRVRGLAAKGAAQALSLRESVMVSGEVQGGVVVEARGTPATYGEVWDYQEQAIQLLTQLAIDTDEAVRRAAVSALVSSIHPYLESERFRGLLAAAFVTLGGEALRDARTEANQLAELFDRVTDVDERRSGLRSFLADLPPASAPEELAVLVHGQRWDFDDGELQRRILEVCEGLGTQVARNALLAHLEAEIPAAHEVGYALSALFGSDDEVAAQLTSLSAGPNSGALVGYLWGLVEGGDPGAFDDFLDEEAGLSLEPSLRLGITVRGPQSAVGWDRVMAIVAELDVTSTARGLFGWHVDMDLGRLQVLLESWIGRIGSQTDYNAAVDFVAMALYKRSTWIESVDPLVGQLVDLRAVFPKVGQQAYDWAQLARRVLTRDPGRILAVVLADIAGDGPTSFGQNEESALFRETLQALGPESWAVVMDRIVAGDWRLQMTVSGWLPDLYETDVITEWIGNDSDRAQNVASVLMPGAAACKPLARALLEGFGSDQRVVGALFANYFSGGWTGTMSSHLEGMIKQLEGWIQDPAETEAVKRWARLASKDLSAQRDAALQREAEGGF